MFRRSCLVVVYALLTGICADYKLRLSLENGISLEKRFLLQGDMLAVNCSLEDDVGTVLDKSAVLPDSNWTLINPELTISNRSWLHTWQFPPLSNVSALLEWRLQIPRPSFTTDIQMWLPKEQWTLEASLEITELLLSYSSDPVLLVDTNTEPIVQWSLGVDATSLPPGGYNWHSTHSPCSPDVSVVAHQVAPDGQITLGVTSTAFLDGSAQWFDVDVCVNITGCTSGTFLDIELTNYHLAILTTTGVYVSDYLLINNTGESVIFWGKSLEPLVSGCDAIDNGRFRYTPHCLSRRQEVETAEILSIVIHCTNGNSYGWYSPDGFVAWETVVPDTDDVSAALVDIAYNVHATTLLALYTSGGSNVLEMQEMLDNSTLSGRIISRYTFPPSAQITSLIFHPLSHILYAYGGQVWASYDGGNHFQILHSLGSGEVEEMALAYYGDVIIARTDTNTLLYSMLGITRLIELSVAIPPSSTLVSTAVDSAQDVYMMWINTGTMLLTRADIDIHALLDGWTESVPHYLVPMRVTDSQYVVYEHGPLTGSGHVSGFTEHHVGQLLTASDGGSGIIHEVSALTGPAGYLSRLRLMVIEPFSRESSSLPGSYNLDVDASGGGDSVVLQLIDPSGPPVSSGWTASDVGKTVWVAYRDSFLIISVTNAVNAEGVSPLGLTSSYTANQGDWAIYNMGLDGGGDALWSIGEDECRHEIYQEKEVTSHTLFELDIEDSITLSVVVKAKAPFELTMLQDLSITHSNTYLLKSQHHWTAVRLQKLQRATITLAKKNTRKGVTAYRLITTHASLHCPRSSLVYSLYSGCPCRKRLVYWPPIHIDRDDYLSGRTVTDVDTSLLYKLTQNYRPPSRYGVGIPTSDHIYNANPSLPIPFSSFRISKTSGSFKQCLGKASKEECGCTDDMKYSEDAQYSDCKQRVYRLLHPGILYPNFTVEQPGKTETLLDSTYHLLHVYEINNRVPTFKRTKSSPLLRAVIDNDELETSGWFRPGGIKITMESSGLHHYRAELPPGFSFCPLYAEFQVYVDRAPIPYCLQSILRFSVTLLIGGVLFVVYLWYLSNHHMHRIRPSGPQCQDIWDMPYIKGCYKPSYYLERLRAKFRPQANLK